MMNLSFRFFSMLFIASSLVSFSQPKRSAGLDQEVLKYTNQFRRSQGLRSLVMLEELNSIARKHSEDMAKGKRPFGHGGFDKRQKEIGKKLKFRQVGENVAFGAHNGREAVIMWENSAGHRQNLLGDYDYIGIGTASDRDGRIYYTQIFVR
jgi:uncharacterized protein YkwD